MLGIDMLLFFTNIKNMNPCLPLLIVLIASFFLSGCITKKIEQENSLVGAMLRMDSNKSLPGDIQKKVVERRKRFEDINDINFVIIREEGEMPKESFEELISVRWHLLRENKQNELLLQDTKVLIQQIKECEIEFDEGKEQLVAKYGKLRASHKQFMGQSRILLDGARPYKRSLLYKFTEPWT